MITVRDIYNEIDRHASFRTAEKWDNCGILAGDPKAEVRRVLTALDITAKVIAEAKEKHCQLIVSHHPVIFTPRKAVLADSPEGMMLAAGISAICVHTPFDMAEEGMNRGLYELLSVPLGLCGEPVPLEDMGNGLAIGMIYDMKEALSPRECASRIKSALGCTCVRFADGGKDIKRIAISSGSGGSFLFTAEEMGADALASGDFKHDAFVDAGNMGMTIIDCGHYHTERIFAPIMKGILEKAFPELEIMEAESCTDPAEYVM